MKQNDLFTNYARLLFWIAQHSFLRSHNTSQNNLMYYLYYTQYNVMYYTLQGTKSASDTFPVPKLLSDLK